MRDVFIAFIVVLFLFTWAYAWQPIYPNIGDYNMNNIKYNFDNIAYTREVLLAGATSYDIYPIATEATSTVTATMNTNLPEYIKAVEVGEGSIEVFFSGALSATAEVSIVVITK